ncbi:MAG: bifunctional tetrahydrofolate synthase/dihydrofolate synthase [Betaproteobacteria bacterium]|nr:bifunctional tetrahydrofolate synthase/dihydrofolate synthase [Betaproteobacteria bacterium]
MDSLAQWLDRLERLHPRSIDLGLERAEAVRARLGLVLAMPLFVVGGTNGKGSVCALLDAMLRSAGYRSGLYTSPHLLRYNERVRIDGAEASDAALVGAFERVDRARGDISLTYFEFGTLAAALLFAEAALDCAVLEVGLGGRLDAVNVFDADCALLTSVDLDHTQYLGSTREAIGYEKAGIFRPDQPAICADPDPPASVVAQARGRGARLLRIGQDFGYVEGHMQWRYWGPGGKRSGLPYPALRGVHQLANAAAAMTALDQLHQRLPVPMQSIRTGLVAVALPGRFQVLPGRPAVILDVAHNAHAAHALARTLRSHGRHARTFAVFAMLVDKDIGAVIDAVKDAIDCWHVASLHGSRGTEAGTLAALLAARDPGKPVSSFDSPLAAFHAARRCAGDDDRIVVFGSFYTVSDIMSALAAP